MNIIGKAEVTAEQMAAYLIERNPAAKPWALEYAQIYLEEGEAEGVRGDGAFIQSCKETGNFKFINTAVTFDQNNFCGMGVTQRGMKGNSFATPRLGVRAQIQHLKGYATAAPLVNACVDPRYGYISPKGKAPRFEDLAGKWAVPGYDTNKASSLQDAMNKGIGYGFDIIAGVQKMKAIKVANTESNNNSYLLAIDAGHGSNTAGKRTPDGYREHWINVRTANYFKIAVERCGFRTVMIGWDDTDATDDVDVALGTRQQQIKASGAVASFSWHANAHGNGTTWTTGNGIETFIHSYAARVGDSRALANKVQNYLIKGTAQANRGVKTGNLAMCNCEAMGVKAAILIEIGFMTNEYEAALLKTDAFCRECAEEAAQGACAYFGVKYKAPSTTNTAPTVTPVVSSDTYVVVAGDTLTKIGKKYGIDWKKIAELNGINAPYRLNIGQVLKLKENTNTYTVKSGDTLSKLGREYGVDWKKIAELNGIKAPYRLNIGQVLVLPEGAKVGSSTTTTTKPVAPAVVTIPVKINQSKVDIQKFLNTYYGTEIKAVLGSTLKEDGIISNNSKRGIAIAIQVELNKLGANIKVDGWIGTSSAAAFDKLVGALKKGLKNNIFVTLWQCVLVAYNLDPNGIDGAYGNGCLAATNTLFTKIGLAKDSVVSGADINALL